MSGHPAPHRRLVVVAESPFIPTQGGGEREHLGFVEAAVAEGLVAALVVPVDEDPAAVGREDDLEAIRRLVRPRAGDHRAAAALGAPGPERALPLRGGFATGAARSGASRFGAPHLTPMPWWSSPTSPTASAGYWPRGWASRRSCDSTTSRVATTGRWRVRPRRPAPGRSGWRRYASSWTRGCSSGAVGWRESRTSRPRMPRSAPDGPRSRSRTCRRSPWAPGVEGPALSGRPAASRPWSSWARSTWRPTTTPSPGSPSAAGRWSARPSPAAAGTWSGADRPVRCARW